MTDGSTAIARRTVLKGGAAGVAGLMLGLAAPAVHAQDRKLSLMILGPDQKTVAWMQEALAAFKADTGYDVELRQSDWGSAFQKLLTAAASGTMADVSMMGQVMTPALASKGAFLPIDDRLSGWADSEQFYPAMLKDGTFDGVSYALPIYADVRTAVYRSDLMEQAGIGADALPTTWDEFKSAAAKLAKANGGPLESPFYSGQDKSVGLMQTFSQMLYQAGGSYFDEGGKSSLASAEGQKAGEFLVSFFAEKLSNPNIVYQGTGPRPLIQGISAMAFNSVAESQNAVHNDASIEPLIVAGPPLMAEAGGTPTTIAWINKFGIGANTKDPDGAWALLSFLTSKDISAKAAELWGGLPARQDLSDAAYLSEISPGFVAATQYAGALPISPNLLQIQKEVNVSMQAAIRQSDSVANILTALDKKIDEISNA
jgi:multiple sugar transport system substrate-binding protein